MSASMHKISAVCAISKRWVLLSLSDDRGDVSGVGIRALAEEMLRASIGVMLLVYAEGGQRVRGLIGGEKEGV